MARTLFRDTGTVSFGGLFANGLTYQVPPFQRDYSWTQENWEDLWDDIQTALGNPDYRHYMGVIVLQARTDHDMLVVDGQQRMATLSLLVIAVLRLLQGLVEREIEVEANSERITILRRNFLGDKDPGSLTYSNKLSLNRRNNDFFLDYLTQLRTPPNPAALKPQDRVLWDGLRFFETRLAGIPAIASSGEALATFLSQRVAGQMVFIRIVVEDQLDAYTVFETLNARGVELTSTDLLKNYLFSMVKPGIDLERMERQWTALIDTVEARRFPDFLRYFLSLEQPRIRKERLFKTARERVRTGEDAFRILDQLAQYSDLFAALGDPTSEMWRESPENQRLIRELVVFGVRQVYPVLFAAYARFSPEDFTRLLKLVVTLSFRFNVISNLNTNELENAYYEAAHGIHHGRLTRPGHVFGVLRSVYVADEKFERDFSFAAFPTAGRNKKLVRYILYKIEEHLGNARDRDVDGGTIEHILPENPTQEWSAAFPAPDLYVNRLGNLTLLEKQLNRELGAASPSEKLETYAGSSYVMTKQIQSAEWTSTAIQARQEQLAAIAAQIWKSDFE